MSALVPGGTITMSPSSALTAFEPSAEAGLAPSYPETRIGPSDVFVQTRTEPLAFVTDRSHRASAASWPETTSDLFFFTQEDPARHEPASASYRYASGQPLTSTDPLGLYTMRENCKCIKDNDPFNTGLVSQENVRQQAEGAIRIMRSKSCSRVLKAAGVFDVMMKVLTPGVPGTEVSCGARVDMGSAPGGYTPYNRKSRKPNAGVLFLSATAFNNYAGRTMFHEAVHAAGWDTNIPSWRSIFRTCLEAGSQEADLDYIDVGYDPSALLEAGVPE